MRIKSDSCPVVIRVAHVPTGMFFSASYPSLKGKTSQVNPVSTIILQFFPAQHVSAIVSMSLNDEYPTSKSCFRSLTFVTRPVAILRVPILISSFVSCSPGAKRHTRNRGKYTNRSSSSGAKRHTRHLSPRLGLIATQIHVLSSSFGANRHTKTRLSSFRSCYSC